MYQKYNI